MAAALVVVGPGVVAPPAEALPDLLSSVDPHEHGASDGHLPAGSRAMKLIAKLRLTRVPDGVSDVAARRGFAYVGAFAAECARRGQGGVHVVDIRRPRRPRRVGFIPAKPNAYVGEGVFVFRMHTRRWRGDVLVHSNERCGDGHTGGISLWDVSNPSRPRPLSQGIGDKVAPDGQAKEIASTVHSVMAWQSERRAYAVLTDTQEQGSDVDIVDITNPFRPRLIAETGMKDWRGVETEGRGERAYHHDMWVKKIRGHWFLLLSYWDAGWILLDVDDPSRPRFIRDSDYPSPDTLTGFDPPEGNAHQATWSRSNRLILAADEDVTPSRTDVVVAPSAEAEPVPAGTIRGTRSVLEAYGDRHPHGTVVYGGSGCASDADGDGTSDRSEVPPPSAPSTGETPMVLFVSGSCSHTEKAESARVAGYEVVIVAADHSGAEFGKRPDAFFCGEPSETIVPIVGVCVGHRAAHLLLGDPEAYGNPEADADDLAGGSGTAVLSTREHFDGWGHLRLLDARTLQERAAYAVPEALDPRYSSGAGELSVHEIKVDRRRGVRLGYASWYAAGARVVRYGPNTLREVGHFIDAGGNDFWGTYPVRRGRRRPLLLFSDRDFGLYILRYTGPER